ncbi:hypothetical protein GCM10010124_05320 [Pilimelia terevasa]|uniref:Uncharacterized protein n=1 Tax=Pilimelia terevasa TaxID=53372 RepID=A0A8J3BFF1_9ACTN|nr:hypothetical protein GCM10010124_05320 [Pilimelia terevasa]
MATPGSRRRHRGPRSTPAGTPAATAAPTRTGRPPRKPPACPRTGPTPHPARAGHCRHRPRTRPPRTRPPGKVPTPGAACGTTNHHVRPPCTPAPPAAVT